MLVPIRGTSVQELASRSFFTVADLLAIEAGDRGLTDRELREVLGVYAIDQDELVPERARLVIDLEEQVLAVGSEQRSLAGRAPTADEVLASYLSLVYTLRHALPGTEIVLRAVRCRRARPGAAPGLARRDEPTAPA